jgi:16S rRNA (uracil1498-N3)-methyltransferase
LARRRFFVDSVQHNSAILSGEEARHLTRVLRVEPGQQYEISDNRSAWLAEIVEARGERVLFRLLEPIDTPPPLVHITLCAAIVKFDRFEWIVEKATELGVEAILPVQATRTEKGLFEASAKRAERWRRIARDAAQQSRRAAIPELLPAVRFTQALTQEATHRYFLDEEMESAATQPLLTAIPAAKTPSDRVAILLGPEGGWTTGERASAHTASWQSVTLGPQILRAETAATAALAVLTAAWLTAYNRS